MKLFLGKPASPAAGPGSIILGDLSAEEFANLTAGLNVVLSESRLRGYLERGWPKPLAALEALRHGMAEIRKAGYEVNAQTKKEDEDG